MKCISEIDFRSIGLMVALGAAIVAGRLEGDELSLTLHDDDRHQTVEHFGASAAWWAQAVGAWPAGARDKVLDLLFDKEKGIGLSLVRYNIGAGKDQSGISDPWRSAASPLVPEGRLDWARDQAAVAVVDGAVARGASVLLFANSPPVTMTVTGKPTGRGGQTNLKPGAEAEFARFLADCAVSLGSRWPLVALSPVNEPQWDWNPSKGQEGCFYTPAEAYRVVTALVSELRSRNLTLPVSAFDSAEWSMGRNKAFIDALASDPSLWPALTPYAVHSYWSDVFDKQELEEYAASRLPGLGLWQTEWTEMRPGRDEGMGAGLTLAQVVHEDLTVGNVRSWQYWIAASKYDYADGLVYVDEARHSVVPTKKLWVLGQWSRFVRPGAVRIGTEVDPSGGVGVSAFLNPDGSRVVVLVNGSEDPVPLATDLSGAVRWETSENRDLENRGVVKQSLLLPPRSVTTLVKKSER